jgi:hypothetical protein
LKSSSKCYFSSFLFLTPDVIYHRRALHKLLAAKKTTILRKAELQERRNSLQHRINAWREIQQIYMPGVQALRESQTAASENSPLPIDQPESTNLYLPSSCPPSFWVTGCIPGLVDKEMRLRVGQADDSLGELRRQLRISSTILDFKKSQHTASQRMSTRTRGLMTRFWDKTQRCAERYNAAFEALSVLDPGGEWTLRLRHLDSTKDLHLPRREDDDPGESRRELSWIWLAPLANGSPVDVASQDEINDSQSLFCCMCVC